MTKATMDSHHRELALNINIVRCENEAQATEAIKEAEVHCAAMIKEAEAHCTIHAHTLEKSQKESMLELECEATAEEGWITEHSWSPVGLSTWSLWGTNVSLAAPYWQYAASHHLRDASYHPTTGYSRQGNNVNSLPTYSIRDASTPNQNKMVVPLSNWEATMLRPEEEEPVGLDITPEEWPCQRQKEVRPLVRVLKDSHQEALGKDSKCIQVSRQAYFKTHHPNYDHKGSQDLSHSFKEVATSTGLWCP